MVKILHIYKFKDRRNILISFKSNLNFQIVYVCYNFLKHFNKYILFKCKKCHQWFVFDNKYITKKEIRIGTKNDLFLCCSCLKELTNPKTIIYISEEYYDNI